MSNDIIRDGPDFPIAVGGVGGSGTRAIANILGQLGYHLGGDLNQERDNLWYTLLFKRRTVLDSSAEQIGQLARIFSSAMSGRPCHDSAAFEKIQELAGEERYGHDAGWLSERSRSLRATLLHERPHRKWAWKEPNTHVLVERLAEHMPGLHYIHVVRDGFDMAFSSNRNQLRYWADTLFRMTDFDPDQPSTALHYWRLVNERIVRLREKGTLPILEVGFECLCERTTEQVLAIAKFCNVAVSSERAREIGAQSVRTPGTVGRHRGMDLTSLDADDCRYASETRVRLLRALETDASTEPSRAWRYLAG